ncbi:putative membrane protein [Colletotrichum siamense]|nr:putative membrane protein [Colletotrichum siamense]
MLARLGLVGLLASCASGAYVQWQTCDEVSSRNDLFAPTSLDAKLRQLDDGDERLSFRVGRWIEEEECEEIARMMPAAALEIQMLGRSSAFSAKTNTTCAKLNFAKGWKSTMRNPASLYVNFETDIGRLPPLSTFHATLHLQSNDSEEISCRQANITPTLDPTTISAIGYTTWGVFLFVFLVGVLRSVYSAPVTLDEEQRSIRTVLPNVGDCLQYIQFVFLTGGLSLRYPGFYQPVVSNLNWFSLFVVGPVTHGVTYDKVQDGIYVMNGTYGGTFGLELMTQIAGAPMTMDTWINMVVLMVIVALGCAVVIEVVWLVNRHRNSDGEVSESTVGLRHTFSRVLRIILSYFMLPLAALSFYQLDHASFLPAYHTSLAVALIVAMMGAFIWLLRQIPTHSLGVLIFDSTKRYRRIAPTEDFRRHDETFILILFVLVFVRGAAIGGLQISGPAQLAVLGSCELLLLASIAGFQAYSTFSIGAIAATMRLCSLIFMVSFLPDLAGHDTKSAIGYLLLALHTGMLLLGFFVPAVCDLVTLCKTWWKAPRPDVYGLRQLRRRQVSRTNLSTMYDADSSYGLPSEHDAFGEPAAGYLHPTYRPDSPSTLRLNSSTTSSRYYRPPRSPSRGTSISSSDYYRRSESIASPASSAYPPSRSTSASTTVAEKRSIQRSESIMSPGRLSEESIEEEDSALEPQPSSTKADGRPLGPRWSDYSFREADLYYGAPRPAPATRASEEIPRPPAPKPSLRSTSGIWAKFTGQPSIEHGFQVVRPPRPEQGFVVVRPNRPSNLSSSSSSSDGETR